MLVLFLLLLQLASSQPLEPGEATLVAAELSRAGNGRGGLFAIDKDFTTSALVQPGADGRKWLKVSLDQIYCVRQVIEFEGDETVQYKWTCSQENCGDCEGKHCGLYELKVYVEGDLSETLPSNSECKHGNRVELEKTGGTKVNFIVYEMAVIATKARCLLATWPTDGLLRLGDNKNSPTCLKIG